MADSERPLFDLPAEVAERDVIQLALERGLAREDEVEAARDLRTREARKDIYRPLLELLVEAGVLAEKQVRRLIDELAHLERPDEPRGYRFLEKVGQGSMGLVYRALQKSLNREVAVKVLMRQYSRNKTYIERFAREALIAAQTASPHFARVYEFGYERGQHFLAMEFVEGESVEKQISSGKKFTASEVVDLAIEVSFALEHLHGLSIVHRDVKPQNIVVAPDGRLKLMDLGLACHLADSGQHQAEQGAAIGTPFYISPEQIRAGAIDARSDLYSLGATLYHLLAGRPPFSGATTPAVLEAHLRQSPMPLAEAAPETPRGLGKLVMKLLEKEPEQRIETARSMRQELLTVESQLDPDIARLKRGTNGQEHQ